MTMQRGLAGLLLQLWGLSSIKSNPAPLPSIRGEKRLEPAPFIG
jgi:hypothetical protein